MIRPLLPLAALAALLATALAAQQPAPRTADPAPPTGLAAILKQSRQVGLPDTQVQGLFDQLRRRGVPEVEAQEAVAGEVESVRAGAAKGSFGAYVNQQIARGLRGRDLSAAIRAEHQRRGVGHGAQGGGNARPPIPPKNKNKPAQP